jgi:hypothetical protein
VLLHLILIAKSLHHSPIYAGKAKKLRVCPLSGEPLVVLTYYKYGTYGTTFKALETINWI